MFKYPEILRISSDRIRRRSDKQYADKGDVKKFFKKKDLVIEEKLDGSQIAFGWKSGQPYIQGKNTHIPNFGDKRPQYEGASKWAWDHIEFLENHKDFLIFGEWLKVQHYIPYYIPDYFIAFDIYDRNKKAFLPFEKKVSIFEMNGVSSAPLLHKGEVTLELIHEITIEKKSSFSDEYMEGCIIKDYHTQTFIKFVAVEFDDTIMGHWCSKSKQKINELRVESI